MDIISNVTIAKAVLAHRTKTTKFGGHATIATKGRDNITRIAVYVPVSGGPPEYIEAHKIRSLWRVVQATGANSPMAGLRVSSTEVARAINRAFKKYVA